MAFQEDSERGKLALQSSESDISPSSSPKVCHPIDSMINLMSLDAVAVLMQNCTSKNHICLTVCEG